MLKEVFDIMESIPEPDWKILCSIRPVALDRYCRNVLNEIATFASSDAGTAHERFLGLWELLRDRDENLARAFDDHSRSNAFLRISTMHLLGMFTDDEFQRFSPATRAFVERMLS